MKKKKFSLEQLANLCAALSYLLDAGLGTGDALTALCQEDGDNKLLRQMADQADRGLPLGEVFRQADAFPDYLWALVGIGEQLGKTAQTLAVLADHYRSREALQRRLRNALQYPGALLAVLLAVTGVLLIWVLPIFQDVYENLGGGLTGIARWLLDLGTGLGKALPWILGIVAAVALVAALPPVKGWAMRKLSGAFGDRGVFGKVQSARFLQALDLALSCGMTEEGASQLAAKLAGEENPGFAKRCEGCTHALGQGKNLALALKDNGFISAGDRGLLEAGLRSGHGEQALHTIAQRALERSEAELESWLGRIEPALVAVSCGVIALVLASVMMPLVQIMNGLG